MEADPELQLSLGSREYTIIINGEITKSVIKPPQSPIPFSITANSSTGEGGGEREGNKVYKCITCNKNFPSFQALGGHRNGHRKPRDGDKEFQFKTNNESVSLQLNKNMNGKTNQYGGNNYNKPKVYGCPVCGYKFTSGQGLGGHMTSHRPMETASSSTPVALELDEDPPIKKMNVMPLDLDLNLPAAEEDEGESKFALSSKQQQTGHVFSAPALVDCQY